MLRVSAFAALLAVVSPAFAESPSYVRTEDVVYGRKFGVALTLDVFAPKEKANGLGLVFCVSGGWYSDRAMMGFPLWTTLGWPLRIGSDPNPRSMRNFCCQANGSEMLRLAACFATEQGIEVCALIHDAVLIAAPLDRLETEAARMQAGMAKASRVVLAGFELRTDVQFVRHPDRYYDPRGALMWDRVTQLIAGREAIQNEVA